MSNIYTTQKIIEQVRKTQISQKEIEIEEIRRLVQVIDETRQLREMLAKIENPRERERFIKKYIATQGQITPNEKNALEEEIIQVNIELGEYKKANRQLRRKLTKDTLAELDYYYLDILVFTERKLGNIGLAKELAIAIIRSNPKHAVAARNELIHISILEGNRQKALEQIQRQKDFYASKRRLPTMEIASYERYEEETNRLEMQLMGTDDKQNSK